MRVVLKKHVISKQCRRKIDKVNSQCLSKQNKWRENRPLNYLFRQISKGNILLCNWIIAFIPLSFMTTVSLSFALDPCDHCLLYSSLREVHDIRLISSRKRFQNFGKILAKYWSSKSHHFQAGYYVGVELLLCHCYDSEWCSFRVPPPDFCLYQASLLWMKVIISPDHEDHPSWVIL